MKSAKILSFLLVLAVLGFVSYRLNRKPEKVETGVPIEVVVDAKAKSVLTAAAKAAAQFDVISYDAAFEGKNGKVQVRGSIKSNPVEEWTFIDVKESRRGTRDMGAYTTSTDAERIYQVSHEQKEMAHGAYPERGYLLTRGADLILPELGETKPFDDELRARIKYEGQKPVGDVNCDVVYVKYRSAGKHARWYFGPDHLPRRVERMSFMFDDIPKEQQQREVLTLSHVDPNPNLTAADFRLALPEGYKEHELLPPAPLLADGTQAPEWELKTPEGKSVSLASLRGRVVLMDFWATWCGPCKVAMPGIQELHEHFDGKPVSVVGVNCQEQGGDPAEYMAKKNFTYTLVMNGDRVAQTYNVAALPSVYVIGPDGKVAHSRVGAGRESELIGIVEGLLPPIDRTAAID